MNTHTQSRKTVAGPYESVRCAHYQGICETSKRRSSPHNWETVSPFRTSLAANYRSACRARSTTDFTSEISVVAEEADESLFWFELLVEAELVKMNLIKPLMKECEEQLKIFSASLTTAKRNR
jgi:hypothetical protein